MSRLRTELRALAIAKAAPQMAPAPQRDPLHALLEEIERMAVKAKQMNLKDTAFILNVAHLDLKSRVHQVSNEELYAISQVIEAQLEH